MSTKTSIYQNYNSYNESHLPWCPQIPSSWNLIPNKGLLHKKKDVVGSNWDQFTMLSLTKQGVIVRDMENIQGKFSADMSGYQRVKPGELIFCLFDIEETPRTVGLSYEDGMITGAYTVFSCKNQTLAKFLELYYIAMDAGKRLSYMYSGLRNTIRPPVFLSLKTPLPSEDEMGRIINFLEAKTSIINKLIYKKQKLIELLQEKRQALITQAVTKGLDLDVKMKDSGTEWVGDMPEGWTIEPMKYLFKLLETRVKHDTSVECLLSVSGYSGIVPKNLEGFEGQMPSEDISEYRIVRKDQLVVNTMWLNYTGLGVSDYVGYVSPAYRVYKIEQDKIKPRYAHYLLRSIKYVQKYSSLLYGVRPNSLQVKPYDFDRIEVLIPTSKEQDEIIDFLDNDENKYNLLESNLKNQIKKLNEFKSALIYNTVTGGIKV